MLYTARIFPNRIRTEVRAFSNRTDNLMHFSFEFYLCRTKKKKKSKWLKVICRALGGYKGGHLNRHPPGVYSLCSPCNKNDNDGGY